MALSPCPWVALVALVALVAPLGTLVASQSCTSTPGHFQYQIQSLDEEERGALAVTNGGHWGQWGDTEFCPSGSFATGFQLKVQPYRGFFGDDTGLNGVRLICDTGAATVTSTVGPFGSWGRAKRCPHGERVTSFRLRVDTSRGIWDDAAATDMAATCSGGTRLEGAGLDWGHWGDWSPRCPRACGICGIRTRVEQDESGDNSGLNDVKMYCCD